MKTQKRKPPNFRNVLYRMAKLELQPGDRIVLQTDLLLDRDQIQRIKKYADIMFKPFKTIIITGGFKLGVLRNMRTKRR